MMRRISFISWARIRMAVWLTNAWLPNPPQTPLQPRLPRLSQ
jgi:hypothetical protein